MLPSVAAYLSRLPADLDSYPDALIKGSVVREVIGESDVLPRLVSGQVPPRVEALMRDPPPLASWVPEVHFTAALAAVGDLCFSGLRGMSAFERWMLERNRTLLASPLYKILFLVVSPERIFLGIEKRWGAFHRGSSLRVAGRAKGTTQLELTFPPQLFEEYALRAFGCAFQAAGEAAGSKGTSSTWSTDGNGTARYEINLA